MSSRTLIGLFATLAILIALAFAVSVSQQPAQTGGGLFLPDLKARINEVDRLVVRTAGDKTVATMTRGKGGWSLAERDGYAADVGKVRKNLIALAEAKILEEKTSNAELYDRLKVEDIAKESAGGVELELGSGKDATRVIIGSTGVSGGERAYARRAGEATSWLVSGSFETPRETDAWLDRRLTDVAPTRIHAVTVSPPGGKPLHLEKATPDAQDFTVRELPAGRELAYPTVANGIGAALSDLDFESVEPATKFSAGDVQPTVARFETVDGLVIEARTYRLPEGTRVRFAASADEALATKLAPPAAAEPAKPADAVKGASAGATAPAESGIDAKETDAARQSFADVKAEAEALNARLGNWVYTIQDFKVEQLTKRLDDLLQPKAAGK